LKSGPGHKRRKEIKKSEGELSFDSPRFSILIEIFS